MILWKEFGGRNLPVFPSFSYVICNVVIIPISNVFWSRINMITYVNITNIYSVNIHEMRVTRKVTIAVQRVKLIVVY